MKQSFLNKNLQLIQKYYNYDETKLKEIKYGLETLYLTISKMIVICLIAYFLDLFKELLLLILFYSILKTNAHGLHAKKSWQCWITSIVIFAFIPFLIKNIIISLYFKIIICITTLILLAIYSPADTEKKPIINKNKRLIAKILTISIAFIYIILIFILNKSIIVNSLIFSLLLQTILITPLSYKIFGLKYNNYKSYLRPKTLNA